VYLVLGLYSFYILDENVSNKKMGIGKSACPTLARRGRQPGAGNLKKLFVTLCLENVKNMLIEQIEMMRHDSVGTNFP